MTNSDDMISKALHLISEFEAVAPMQELNQNISLAALLLARTQLSAAMIQSAKSEYERNELFKKAENDLDEYWQLVTRGENGDK